MNERKLKMNYNFQNTNITEQEMQKLLQMLQEQETQIDEYCEALKYFFLTTSTNN